MRPEEMRELADLLDGVANVVEPKDQKLAFEIDRVADALERRADVLQRDMDEPYMDRYNQDGALQHDADEPYMSQFTNTQNEAPVVRERWESPPRDMTPGAQFVQQPSQRHIRAPQASRQPRESR